MAEVSPRQQLAGMARVRGLAMAKQLATVTMTPPWLGHGQLWLLGQPVRVIPWTSHGQAVAQLWLSRFCGAAVSNLYMFIVSSTIAREWLGIDKVIVRDVLLSIHLLLTLRLFFRIGVQVFVLQNC